MYALSADVPSKIEMQEASGSSAVVGARLDGSHLGSVCHIYFLAVMMSEGAAGTGDDQLQTCLEEMKEMLKHRRRCFSERAQFLQEHVFKSLEPVERTEFLLKCLMHLLKAEALHSSQLSHLLLEIVLQDVASDVVPEGLLTAVVALFEGYCQAGCPRLAVKVAKVFRLCSKQIVNVDLVDYIRSLFECNSTHTPALSLLMHFDDLNDNFKAMEIAEKLIRGNSIEKSMEWIRSLDAPYHHEIIRVCEADSKWKLAWTVTKALGLEDNYRHIHLQLRRESIKKLVHRKNWTVALAVAENCRELQILVVEAMVQCNEVDLATEYQSEYGLPKDLVFMDDATRALTREQQRNNYYQLQLPDASVMLVSEADRLSEVQRVLSCEPTIGFDVEWKSGSSVTNASTLQLAGENCCYILDLHALRESEALHTTVASVFCNESILKLGFSPLQDLQALGAVCRVQRPSNIADLQELWTARGQQKNPHEAKRKQSVGLSQIVLSVLGKPLDKSMQLSDWDRRPLTDQQLRYAAQDAHVLLTLYRHIAADTSA